MASKQNIDDIITQVKRRLPQYLESLGHHINGNNMTKCPLPTHADKNPSFSVGGVGGREGTWYCHGCQRGGDIFVLANLRENLPYRGQEFLTETLPYFTTMFGIPYDPDQIDMSKEQKFIHSAHKAYRKATQLLKITPAVREYAYKLGWTDDTLHAFHIGTVNSYEDFLQRLKSDGYTENFLRTIRIAGNTRASKPLKEQYVYRMFSSTRMIIPVRNINGHVVGFSARDMTNESDLRYINTYTWEGFQKREMLFNLNGAVHCDTAYIMEGATDVITAYEHGIRNAIGVLTSTLSKDHFETLNSHFTKTILTLDGEAGAAKHAQKAMASLQNPRAILLPQDSDPDSYLREHGAEAFLDLEELTEMAHEIRIDDYRQSREKILMWLEQIQAQNPVEHDYYLRHLSEASGAAIDTLRQGLWAMQTRQATKTLKALLRQATDQQIHLNLNLSYSSKS